MQNAFNTAAVRSTRTAYIPAGTYLHSAVLTLGGVTVTGAGAQTILVGEQSWTRRRFSSPAARRSPIS